MVSVDKLWGANQVSRSGAMASAVEESCGRSVLSVVSIARRGVSVVFVEGRRVSGCGRMKRLRGRIPMGSVEKFAVAMPEPEMVGALGLSLSVVNGWRRPQK